MESWRGVEVWLRTYLIWAVNFIAQRWLIFTEPQFMIVFTGVRLDDMLR